MRRRDKNWTLSTGFVGVSHLLPVLDEEGRSDIAYRLLLQDEFPSWLFSVKHGATTIWERWNGWTPEDGMNDPGMNSFNHFALGSCGEWLYSGVAGIALDPDHPGMTHVNIRPQLTGPMTAAQAEVKSVHGRIASEWTIDEGHLSLNVTIPANTTASVVIPTVSPESIMESDAPLANAEGIHAVVTERGSTTIEVGSGSYRFTSNNIGSPDTPHH